MADASKSDSKAGGSETPFLLRGRTARDLMTPSPRMVFATDPLETAAELLARYSAVPVVDLERCVIGVLSRTDLSRIYGLKRSVQSASLTLESRDQSTAGSELEWKPPQKRVSEVMTPQVFTAQDDALASEIVRTLSDKRIGRVFIVDSERHLIGVVSTTDIISRLRAAD